MHTILDASNNLLFIALSQGTDISVSGNQYQYIQDGARIELRRPGGASFWYAALEFNQVGAALSALGTYYQTYNVETQFTVFRRNYAVAEGRVISDSAVASA